MESVTLKDFLTYRFLSDVKLSPDGKSAAYMRHGCDILADGYRSCLCLSDLEGNNIELTDDGKKRVFCWDGGNMLLHGIPEENKTTFFRVDKTKHTADGFTIPLKVRTIERMGEKQYLVSARVALDHHENRDDDCFVAEELPISSNGVGYTAGTRISLYVFDEEQKTLMPVTPLRFETMAFTFCASQGKIVVSGQEFSDKRIIRGGIYLYDIASKTGHTVLEKGTYRISWVGMLGERILFAGTAGKHNSIMENPYFYTLDPETGEIDFYADPGLYIGGLGMGSDCRYGSGTLCKQDGERVYFCAADNGSSPLFVLEEDRETRRLTFAQGSCDCFDVVEGRVAFVGMVGNELQELYMLDPETRKEKRLTSYNLEYVQTHSVVTPEPCGFVNSDGIPVSGWVLKPVNYDPAIRYPAILDIHGGPKAAYGTVYVHEMQVWANMGYFVFFCNPRGSDGHGDAYSRIMGINGSIDYEDILEFVDHVLSRFPAIDPSRIGVTGGSYGGYMTNWIVGHTDRFACAATQRSIGDWLVHEYASDTGYWVTSEMFAPSSIEQAERAWDRSPGKYSINTKTPMLFIHSDQDMRCPLSEAMAAYSGAVRSGATVRMVLFHGENHELSRSGKPSNRVKRLQEITNWMERYLKEGIEA